MTLILASQSPRRRDMIRSLGIEPIIQPADIDETPLPGELPVPHVQRLARQKCLALGADQAVLAADTIVVVDQQILGKPADQQEFVQMMRLLSARWHQVYTAWHIQQGSRSVSDVECTEVRFCELTDQMIQAYWASGEPCDKAGGYGIQGWGGLFVEQIKGDFNNVVGLPLKSVAAGLAQIGINPWELPDAR